MLKKQDCTAMSSAEAEYVALSVSCAQVMLMMTQLKDYGSTTKYRCIVTLNLPYQSHATACNTPVPSTFILDIIFLSSNRFQYLVKRIGMRCLTPTELEVLANESA
ncbi:hypothetical protein Tco_0149131 [Tanacetum coccineum]